MFVKINGEYVNVYLWDYKYMFELTGHMEPDLCYLALNESSKYIYVGYDEEYEFNIPQGKIKREIKKLQKLK